jgi:hypothetical protein
LQVGEQQLGLLRTRPDIAGLTSGNLVRAAAGRFGHGGALSPAPDLVARVFEGLHDRLRLSHGKERVQAKSCLILIVTFRSAPCAALKGNLAFA